MEIINIAVAAYLWKVSNLTSSKVFPANILELYLPCKTLHS